MTSRCLFMTSSNCSSFLRAWKFWSSTRFCAWPMAAVTHGWVMTSPSSAQKRSEEHTSELQSHHELVCRLLLEKKKPRRVAALTATPSQARVLHRQRDP